MARLFVMVSLAASLGVPASAGALSCPVPGICGLVAAQPGASLEEVYGEGQSWGSFYEGVNARRALWIETWNRAAVSAELADRARSAGGPWRILVITEPGCSDSANSVPYIAKLVQQAAGLELRLVDSSLGRPWLEAHRSPDGRAATPTVLVLDESYRIRGCWIEQPAELRALWLPILARGAAAAELSRKMEWYAADAGREVLRELVEVLEAAHAGRPTCPGPT